MQPQTPHQKRIQTVRDAGRRCALDGGTVDMCPHKTLQWRQHWMAGFGAVAPAAK